MKIISQRGTGQYIILQSVCILISPLFSLLLSLRYYKHIVSQVFFIIYAFYYGFQVDVKTDLAVHYENFLLFCRFPLAQALKNPNTLYLGGEFYPLAFKSLLSWLTSDSRFFAGCACAAYALIFVFFIRQFKSYFSHKFSYVEGLVFCGICFTVEYHWYLGLRFWSGAFFFMAFYIKYILSRRIKYFIVASLAGVIFHNALLLLPCVEIVNYVLRKRSSLKGIVFFASFFFRHLYSSILNIFASVPFLNTFINAKYTVTDEQKIDALLEKGDSFREQGNLVYQMRFDVLFFTCLILFFLLWRKNKKITELYSQLLGFILLLTTLCNLMYDQIIFFQRFYKLATVLFFSYLFLVLQDIEQKWINRKWYIIVPLFFVIFYALLTPFVEQRQNILSLELWFGNFFTMINL